MKLLNFLLMLVFTLSFTVVQAQTQSCCKKDQKTCIKSTTATQTAAKTVALEGKSCDVKLCDGKPCPIKCCKEAGKATTATSVALFTNAVNPEAGKVCQGKTNVKQTCGAKGKATAQKANLKTVAADGKACCSGLPCPVSCCKTAKTKAAKLALAEKE